LGFKQEQKNGKDLGYAYLEKYSENDAFKVKGDKNRKGFRIWSTNEEQIFSYNQGSMFSIKGGYYMWKVDKKDPWNDYHMEDYYTRFIFDDKTQSLTAKIPSLFSEYPLAITEGKKGTQIYQKMLYNGMMMKNTRFCFVAKKKHATNNSGQGTGNQEQITQVHHEGNDNKQKTGEGNDNKQKTGEGDDNKQDTDNNDNDGHEPEELGKDDSSAASVGVLVALITLCIVN